MNSLNNKNLVTMRMNDEFDDQESTITTNATFVAAKILPNLTSNKIMKLFRDILQDLSEEIDIFAVILIILSLMIAIVGLLIISFHCCLWKKSQKLSKSYDASSWLEYKLDRSKLNKNSGLRYSFSSSITSSVDKNANCHYHNRQFNNTQQQKYLNEKHKRMITFLWNKSMPISSFNHQQNKSSESLSTSGLNLSPKCTPGNVGFDYLIYHHNDKKNDNQLNIDDPYLTTDLKNQDLHSNQTMNSILINSPFAQMPFNSTKQNYKMSSLNNKINRQNYIGINKRENRFVIGKTKLKRSLFSNNKKKKEYYPSKIPISDTEPFFTSSISSSRSNRTISEYINASTNLNRDYEIQTAEMNLTESDDDGIEKMIFHNNETLKINTFCNSQQRQQPRMKQRNIKSNIAYLENKPVTRNYKSFSKNPLYMEMYSGKNLKTSGGESSSRIFKHSHSNCHLSLNIDNLNNRNNLNQQRTISSVQCSTFQKPSFVS